METAHTMIQPTTLPYMLQSSHVEDTQDVHVPEHIRELVAGLRRRTKSGVRVEICPVVPFMQVRVDVVISSAHDRVGIVCDQSDARRLGRHSEMLNALFVDRAYVCTALDTIMDPDGVAAAIAAREHHLFNGPAHSRRRGPAVLRLPRRGHSHASEAPVLVRNEAEVGDTSAQAMSAVSRAA